MKPSLPPSYGEKTVKFTTQSGKRFEFLHVRYDYVPSYRVYRLNFLISSHRHLVIEHPVILQETFQDENRKVRREVLLTIFSAIQEALFYEKALTDQDIEEIKLIPGKDNILRLSFDESNDLVWSPNRNYTRERHHRISYEICKLFDENYSRGLALVTDKIWFPPEFVYDVLESGGNTDSPYWVLKGDPSRYRLTQAGEEFLKKYNSKEENEVMDISTSEIDLPDFDFINDVEIKRILKRDWAEVQRNIQVKNWKSAIVLCGCILEAILIDVLSQKIQNAENPKEILGGKRSSNLEEWRLKELIAIAKRLNPISEIEKLGTTLKDYRNLIHLHKKVRNKGKYKIDEPEATASFSVLKGIVRDLSS